METVQMNTRIDLGLKRSGDAVLRRNGYSPTAAVKALWSYVSEHNALPSFMPERTSADAKASRLAAIQEEQGMAWRLFSSLTGIDGPSPTLDRLTDDELLELAWEERGAFDD